MFGCGDNRKTVLAAYFKAVFIPTLHNICHHAKFSICGKYVISNSNFPDFFPHAVCHQNLRSFVKTAAQFASFFASFIHHTVLLSSTFFIFNLNCHCLIPKPMTAIAKRIFDITRQTCSMLSSLSLHINSYLSLAFGMCQRNWIQRYTSLLRDFRFSGCNSEAAHIPLFRHHFYTDMKELSWYSGPIVYCSHNLDF